MSEPEKPKDWLDDMNAKPPASEPVAEKKRPYERVWVDVEACPTCGRENTTFGIGLRFYKSHLDEAEWTLGYVDVIGEVEMKFRDKNGHHVHYLRRESEK